MIVAWQEVGDELCMWMSVLLECLIVTRHLIDRQVPEGKVIDEQNSVYQVRYSTSNAEGSCTLPCNNLHFHPIVDLQMTIIISPYNFGIFTYHIINHLLTLPISFRVLTLVLSNTCPCD